MSKLEKNIYGVTIINSQLANFNADFSGEPKKTSEGVIYASDCSYKYLIRNYLKNKGKKIFLIKSYSKTDKGDLKVNTLSERYQNIFGKDVSKNTINEILENLVSCDDIKNFGVTFATEGKNCNINGAVQLSKAINLYKYTNIETQNVLSPFANSNKPENNQATLGSNTFTDNAYYGYSIAVNPKKYDNYTFEYTEEDFLELKEALLNSASDYTSTSKMGIENIFGIFIYMEKDFCCPVINLHNYISIKSNENYTEEIDLTRLFNLLEDIKNIEKVEIYYNNHRSDLIIPENTINYKKFSLLNNKELK